MNAEQVLHIRIAPTATAIQEVQQQLAALDGTSERAAPLSELSLPDADAYYSLLTKARIALLSALRRYQPMSIRALSRQLGRDYKNVHTDTIALIEAGLIERDADKEISTPWDRLAVSLPLSALPVDEAA